MEIILGHLVGDYLLQNKWMAMNKTGSTFKCAIHCLIYTLAVCITTMCFSVSWIAIVFCSHFFIDRFSIADKWLSLINGRSLKDYIENGMAEIPYEQKDDCPMFWNYHALRGGFTSLVYAVADNTMHLLIMWYGWKLIALTNL